MRKRCRLQLQSPTFSSKNYTDVPYLDVSTTADDARTTLSLAVVNRHKSDPISTTITIENAQVNTKAEFSEINGASVDAENSFAQPNNVRIDKKDPVSVGGTFTYTFPAHSITVLKLKTTGAH